jgi:hypothetical protein
MSKSFSSWCITAAFLSACAAHAESVSSSKASYIDVQQRHTQLTHNKNPTDPRTAQAIASLSFCTKLPLVPPPTGRMIIPPHYISGGHGPINPAEAEVTHVYNSFERRVTAGMNQWLVTSSSDDGPDFFAFAEFYSHHVDPAQIPASILKGLERPSFATRIGGSTTVIDGYAPARVDEHP